MSIQSQSAAPFSNNGVSVTTSSYTYSNWLDSRANDINILYRVATLNATSLTLNIQGRHNNAAYDYAASIYTKTISAVQSIHGVYHIPGNYEQIRIGAKINLTATPNILYAGMLRTEYKG